MLKPIRAGFNSLVPVAALPGVELPYPVRAHTCAGGSASKSDVPPGRGELLCCREDVFVLSSSEGFRVPSGDCC